MTRRSYRVAGQSLLVESPDARTAHEIDAIFAGWYLAPDNEAGQSPSRRAIVLQRADQTIRIPVGLDAFEIAGNGVCYTDGSTSYIDIEGSTVVIGRPRLAPVEVWTPESLPLHAPALTRVLTYALAAALRQRRLFELHSGALADPESGKGLLIVGPSGSGKSTLTVHLAAAGWPFLTDDVLLLSEEAAEVKAWPLRRCFAVTSQTFAASRFLQARTPFVASNGQELDKQSFLPHQVFAAEAKDHCVPQTLFFSELSGSSHSRVSRLSPGDTMARLIRMNPWSCYDRSTAAEHLAVFSALARQSTAFSLLAGEDLLDPETSVDFITFYARE